MAAPTHKRIIFQAIPSRQSGAVLAISILILLVLTVLGITSMSSSNMQERMSGNAKLQAEAFEASSAGVAQALDYVVGTFDDPSGMPPGTDDQCGAQSHTGWVNASGEFIATDWQMQANPPADGAFYELRMYCLEDPDGDQPRSQLFVESRGRHMAGGDVVAERKIEVRVGLVGAEVAGDGCGALCFPGGEGGQIEFPTSNAFAVDGDGGPAITTGNPLLTDDIRDAIRDNRIGNYNGGLATTSIGSPWNDAGSIEAFRQWVEIAANIDGEAVYDTSATISGNPEFGTPTEPEFTYFEDDVDFDGTPSGAGIMVINGSLEAGGTPQFDGLLVVLGGSYSVGGGGTGGGPAGSVVILNSAGNDLTIDADFTGGGNALYAFSCENLTNVRNELIALDEGALPDDDTQAGAPSGRMGDLADFRDNADSDELRENLWDPECDPAPSSLGDAERSDLRVLSWRENIGWREEDDFKGASVPPS